MKLRTLATCSALFVATCALAQDAAKPKGRRTIVNLNPDPTSIFLGDADVRVQNRPGVGVLVAIDEMQQRKGDGIIDRVVVLLGADDQPEFTGPAIVSLCKSHGGGPESIVVDPWDPNLAKTFVAFVGVRPTFHAKDARVVATRGIAEYTGLMVRHTLADLDKVRIGE